jgi:hypothetical protein
VLDQLVNGSLAKVLLQSTEPERFHSLLAPPATASFFDVTIALAGV